MKEKSEAERLEGVWAGEFGAQYIERNKNAHVGRDSFWNNVLSQLAPYNILEVGCNVGPNLNWIKKHVLPRNVFGVDINEHALETVRRNHLGVNAVWSPARTLPFRDAFFDLVFTGGVLIHQPPEMLPIVMAEIVRCSRRHVMCIEYYAETLTEVPYRGQERSLFKQDFGGLYARLFPELTPIDTGFLSRDESVFDDATYWIFEKNDRPSQG